MRTIISFICFGYLFLSFNVKGIDPTIKWDKKSHDFGTIKQGEVVETVFTFVNLSKDTFQIENVKGSCGCLANQWTQNQVYPNQSGTVTVRFDSKGKTGQHLKSVTVYSNLGAYFLEINANVEKLEN